MLVGKALRDMTLSNKTVRLGPPLMLFHDLVGNIVICLIPETNKHVCHHMPSIIGRVPVLLFQDISLRAHLYYFPQYLIGEDSVFLTIDWPLGKDHECIQHLMLPVLLMSLMI